MLPIQASCIDGGRDSMWILVRHVHFSALYYRHETHENNINTAENGRNDICTSVGNFKKLE